MADFWPIGDNRFLHGSGGAVTQISKPVNEKKRERRRLNKLERERYTVGNGKKERGTDFCVCFTIAVELRCYCCGVVTTNRY